MLEPAGACYYVMNMHETMGWKVRLTFKLENLCIKDLSPDENVVELELEPDGGEGYVLMKPIARGESVSYSCSVKLESM